MRSHDTVLSHPEQVRFARYFECMVTRYPDVATSPFLPEIKHELVLLARDHSSNDDQSNESLQRSVSMVNYYFSQIKFYLKAVKAHAPNVTLSKLSLELLHCVNYNYGFRRRDKALAIADIIDHWLSQFTEAPMLDRTDLSILCHLVETKQALSLQTKDTIREALAEYLEYRPRGSFCHNSLIGSYLWIREHYPDLNLLKAARWADSLGSASFYRHTIITFNSEFPFSGVLLTSYLNGEAALVVVAHNPFGAPLLDGLKEQLKNVGPFLQYEIVVWLYPNSQSLDHLRWKARHTLSYLEELLYDHVDASHYSEKLAEFRDKTRKILAALEQHFQDVAADFPEFRAYQLTPPTDRKPTQYELDLYHLIDHKKDAQALREELAYGRLDPNAKLLNRRLFHFVCNRIKDYEFYLLLGDLEESHRDKLRDTHAVIIAKQNGHINLYWEASLGLINIFEIQDTDTREFLDALITKRCDKPNRLRFNRCTDELNKLTALIEPWILPSWQKERMQVAKKQLALVKTVVAYGTDPRRQQSDDEPSALNYLINEAYLCHGDAVNIWLLKEMVKAVFLADRGQTGMYIAGRFRQHPIGQFILKGQQAIKLSRQLPPRIAAVTPAHQRRTLSIINDSDEAVTLETIPLQKFIQDPRNYMGIIWVSASAFLNDNPITITFVDYVMNKLKASSQPNHRSMIDVLRDSQGRIVAYNIVDIVLPTKSGETTIYYLRLAGAEKWVTQHFSKLMTIVMFHRTLLLSTISENVLTAFTAASAVSYLMTASLPEVYPKKPCLKPKDKELLYQTFFKKKGRSPIEANLGMHFKSQMFYEATPRSERFNSPSDNERDFFNVLIQVPGCSTLVAFYATVQNMRALASSIGRRIAPTLSLEKIVAAAMPLTIGAISPGAKL